MSEIVVTGNPDVSDNIESPFNTPKIVCPATPSETSSLGKPDLFRTMRI